MTLFQDTSTEQQTMDQNSMPPCVDVAFETLAETRLEGYLHNRRPLHDEMICAVHHLQGQLAVQVFNGAKNLELEGVATIGRICVAFRFIQKGESHFLLTIEDLRPTDPHDPVKTPRLCLSMVFRRNGRDFKVGIDRPSTPVAIDLEDYEMTVNIDLLQKDNFFQATLGLDEVMEINWVSDKSKGLPNPTFNESNNWNLLDSQYHDLVRFLGFGQMLSDDDIPTTDRKIIVSAPPNLSDPSWSNHIVSPLAGVPSSPSPAFGFEIGVGGQYFRTALKSCLIGDLRYNIGKESTAGGDWVVRGTAPDDTAVSLSPRTVYEEERVGMPIVSSTLRLKDVDNTDISTPSGLTSVSGSMLQ